MRNRIGAVVLGLLVAGCAGSQKDVKAAHDAGEGSERVFDVTTDQAWAASRAALRWNDGQAIEEHKADGYMIATAPMRGFSNGASMGVWISPVGEQASRVRVIVSRSYALNWTGQSESGVLGDVAKAVALVKAGKPLPDNAP